jgi:hypothetical protein
MKIRASARKAIDRNKNAYSASAKEIRVARHARSLSLVSGRSQSFADIAKAEACSECYVSRLMPLAFLAPDIVEAILAGTQPVELTAETLTRHADLPLSWVDQKALLGFN